MTKLSQYPHESNLAIILNDLIRLYSANQWHELVHKVRIFPQDIFKYLDCFCGHVGDLETKEVLELRANRLGQVWKTNYDCAEACDRAFGDFSADIGHVLAQLVHNLLNVAL